MAKRLEDKYDGEEAMSIALSMLRQNQQEVAKFLDDNSTEILERAYRAGYTKALEDYGIEIYPKNITSRETIELDE